MSFPLAVLVGVRQQGQVTRALDRERQLALVLRLGAGDARGHDLAGLGHVLLQRGEILVVDLGDAFGGELAELLAAEILGGHVQAPAAVSAGSTASGAVSPSPLSRRDSGFFSSSGVLNSGDWPVTGPSVRTTSLRITASLKRNAFSSSASALSLHSTFNST